MQATEAAANTIMEAAEAIQGWLEGGQQDAASLRLVSEKVSSIFEACSFQDVTGQRIRRAIQLEYRLRKRPDATRMRTIARPWQPYRSLACLYLWSSLDNAPA